MTRYADGDAAAFATVYDELAPALYRYLQKRLQSDAACDDVLQQAFVQLHLNRGRFVRGSRVEPWAYALTHAVSVDHVRREYRRRYEELDDYARSGAPDPEQSSQTAALSDALRRELGQISPKLSQSFRLVRLEGLSHAEAAQVLGVDVGVIKVRVHRAATFLRARLARFAWGEP
jgi:RNA polymerase sigma-70 factor (ECF subfamily)